MGELILSEASAEIVSRNAISPEDVQMLRQVMFKDGRISRSEAESLFALDEAVRKKCNAWNDFFVEALVDYTVHQMEPSGYVSEENARWLMKCISRDNLVETATELELLVRILEEAKSSSEFLVKCALEQVSLAVIEGKGVLRNGQFLLPGVIYKAEVDLLRRILYAFGGDGNVAISRCEAEVLFDLNDKTIEAKNHPSWSDLFVKAIASFLMVASGYEAPNRRKALYQGQWLSDQPSVSVGKIFSRMFSGGLGSVGSALKNGLDDSAFKSARSIQEDLYREKNAAMEIATDQAEAIDEDEARWLAGRIGRDGILHENEKALLRFLKEESPSIHPALNELIARAA